ncbi:MAG: stage II sporulation protein D [Eubacteriales bacterium]
MKTAVIFLAVLVLLSVLIPMAALLPDVQNVAPRSTGIKITPSSTGRQTVFNTSLWDTPSAFMLSANTSSSRTLTESKLGIKLPDIIGKRETEIVYPDTIKVLETESGKVREVPLEDYLVGVVFSEMPASFEAEALKAQAVAARSYCLFKWENSTEGPSAHSQADVCDDPSCCKGYTSYDAAVKKWGEDYIKPLWEKVEKAVEDTCGQIITYDGQVANAVFHAMSAYKTEDASSVWGGNAPYLKSVSSPEEEKSGLKDFITTVSFTSQQFKKLLTDNGFRGSFDGNASGWIGETIYNGSERVDSQEICGIKISGGRIREIFALRSTNFSIECEGDDIIFTVKGYGHGVGLSQQGANLLAKEGYDYVEILKHYYTGTEVVR